MRKVGLRELKNRLGRYVQHVRAGGEIQVTDRGQVVAELLPPRRLATPADARRRLADLARRGLVTLGERNDPRLYRRRLPPLVPPGTAKRLLDEDRGNR